MPRKPWRAGWLGKIFHVHSVSDHATGNCWCISEKQRRLSRKQWAGMFIDMQRIEWKRAYQRKIENNET